MSYFIVKLEHEKLVNDFKFWNQFDALSGKIDRAPQLSSSWLIPFIKNRLQGMKPFVFAAYLGDKLVGCLPLQKRSIKATRFWNYDIFEFLGYGPTDFFEIVALNDSLEIKKALLNFFFDTQKWDFLKLDLLPNGSILNPYLQNKLSKSKHIQVDYNHSTGFQYETTTNINLDHYFNTIFKKKNKDLLKGERRLSNDNIDYKINTFYTGIYSKFIKNVKLYAKRRESLGQYNFYEDESYCQFLKEVCSNYEEKKCIEFSTLETKGGDIIAIQLDFLLNKIRFHWNHAFNEDYKRYSPGKILLKELLFLSIQSNHIDECNHMRGLSNYKEKFTSYTAHFINYKLENKNSLKIKLTRAISKVLKLIK